MNGDPWAALADEFVEEAYATVKGQVRTYVLHHQLLDHLPSPPATVLDVGGGAGHQSFPLARAGYGVTLLDPSPAMLAKAEHRLAREPPEVRGRVRLLQARGEDAAAAAGGQRFAAVLCHGVLMYVEDPGPLIGSLCACTAPGGVVSVMALNAATLAIRPALEHRWADALAAFGARREAGVLGVDTRADTVAELEELLRANGAEPAAWYGVWLFTDWMDVSADPGEVGAVAAVELEASRRDPYRQLSRVFHLVARTRPDSRAENRSTLPITHRITDHAPCHRARGPESSSAASSGIQSAYSGKFTEAGLRIAGENDPPGLCPVRGDDQVMRGTRSARPPHVREQAAMVGRRGLRVVKDFDGGRDGGQRPGAIGRPRRGISHLDSDAVLGDRDGRDRQLVLIQSRAVDGSALVSDQDVGVEDQASAHGSITSERSRATASAMCRLNVSSGGGTSASAERKSAPVRRCAGPISATA